MSQGFRKGGKIPELSDTTGITPPIRADQQRNSRRQQQITNLHQEFQDLKKKIKEVQNKNQKIIEKIYKAYNFKKKNAYTEEYIGSVVQSPVIHYENKYDGGFSGAMSVDAGSNKSDQSQKQLKLQKRSTDLASRKASLKNQKFNYSLEYGKTDTNIAAEEYDVVQQTYINQPQMRYTTGQFPQMPPAYPQNSQSFTSVVSQKKVFEELNQEKQLLEQQLSQKSSQLIKLSTSMKNINRNLKGMIQTTLQDFYENVCHRNLLAIQKAMKKYEQKLKNVKKITMMIKDKQQDKRSSRLLQYGRQRRSVDKSRRASPPRDNSRIINNSRDQRQSRSRSKLAGQQGQKNKKQFQEIANRYEQIIRTKNQEIQKWDKKYKLKQRQCYELKMRIDIIQKRLTEQQRKSSSRDTSQDGQQFVLKNNKRITSQSDLLSGMDDKGNNLNIFEEEILKLQAKVQELHAISNEKSTQLSNIQNLLAISENKNKQLQSENQENLNKSKQKYLEEQEKYKKQFEKIIAERNEEILSYKNTLMVTEKKYLQKQCELYSLQSKLKKIQGLISSKDQKIEQLEKIIGDSCPTDRSIIMNSTIHHASDNSLQNIRKLKGEIQQLETKLEGDKNEIFSLTKKNNYYKTKIDQLQRTNNQLKKQVESLQIQNQQLKINANINNISVVMKQSDENSKDEDDINHSLAGMDENVKKLTSDLDAMNEKVSQISRQKEQWYEKYQKIKNTNLQKQSQNIKLQSQYNFMEKQLTDCQNVINKIKAQNQKYKIQNKELQNKLHTFEQQIEMQRQQFKTQLNDIQKRWFEFEQDMKKSAAYGGEVDKSQKSSMISYSQRNKIQHINTQNQYLSVKLKEVQAELQTQKMMEQKIIDQYQANMQEYKIEIKNKSQQIKMLKEQIQDLNTKMMNLTMRLQAMSKIDSPTTPTHSKKQQKNQLLERIEELEAELKQAKEINAKLTDMQGQLFDQIKIKQEERGELYEQLNKRQARIQELEEIIEMRGGQMMEQANTHASHMSQSTHKRQSIKSQSSLKYSQHSQILRKSRMFNSGKSGVSNEQKLFDLDLSEAGSEFYEQPSQISNISQFFQKQELPYEKIKIKRHEQIKLFQKTASYIKSLKKAIEQKNKKIKLLEKKIQSLKHSELVRKELGLDIDIKQDRYTNGSDNLQADNTFRDYESVQLQYKRGGYLRKYKQLEHDTKLVMEENNLLTQQIQTLEEQLLKAEEQQNSLVKIKDLYKEEIKKLIKKNQEQAKTFEQQLRNQRKRVEDSENVHNIQAIKQLFIKTIQITGLLFTQQNLSSKKKQQKRKEIQEFIKIISSIFKLDKQAKQNLLMYIRK